MKKSQIFIPQQVTKLLSVFLLAFVVLASTSQAYERIVSTTGNMSEVIAEMGFADKLVAVDTTSVLPKAVMDSKPKIGYRRALSSEGILSMRPDLLILAPDAGPPAVIKQLNSANVETVMIKDEKSLAGVVDDIALIAEKLNAKDKAKPIIQQINDDEKIINTLISEYPKKPKIAFFMDGGAGRYMGLGDGTAGDGMIEIVGGENIFSEQFKSVKPVSLESLAVGDMDMIIFASHGGKEQNSASLQKALDKYPALAITKAGKKGCVFTIGIIEALGFGPHLTDAAKEIAGAVKNCVK